MIRKRPAKEIPIVITEADLPPDTGPMYGSPLVVPQTVLQITDADLDYIEQLLATSAQTPALVTITLDDLARVNEQLFQVDWSKIPAAIRISLDDLPADLNYLTTECYHGTSREAGEQIRREGFRVGNGVGMGAGIYFSVGAMTIAQGFVKGNPCIVRAKVDWGKVAYLDDPKIPTEVRNGSGDQKTEAALRLGYHSLLSSSKFSQASPAIGVVLGRRGTLIKPPRIEVVELIDPRSVRK